MRLFVLFLLTLISVPAALTAASDNIELMNANLITKLHLDPSPRNGQMVGAYIATFRPSGDKPVSKITVLLNPGLQFVKAESGSRRLNATSELKAITGLDMLELNVVEINLGRTLSKAQRAANRDRIDVAIHYRGYLEDVSWTGLKGAKETLSPSFTMLRAESFGYPVFAAGEIGSIKKAWARKPFHQIASVEYPGAGTAVSNLIVDSRAVNGSKTAADLKTGNPAPSMVVAIGSYNQFASGPVSVSYLDGNQSGAQSAASVFTAEAQKLTNLLGPTRGSLKVIEVPMGYLTEASSNAVFVDSSFMSAPQLTAAHKARIFNLWKLNKSGRQGHWGSGLDAVINTALTAPDMIPEAKMVRFSSAKQMFSGNAKLGKTSLADYTIEGFSAQSDAVSTLAFAVLYDLLGHDQFFAVVRSLRSELGAGYVDMESVAKLLQKNIKDKKAKRFAKNWFSSGKSGKDMAKANSFADLVARYK